MIMRSQPRVKPSPVHRRATRLHGVHLAAGTAPLRRDFIQLNLRLDVALDQKRLSPIKRAIVGHVLRHTLVASALEGADPVPCHPNFSELARSLGCDNPSHLNREKAKLVRMQHVLIEDDDGGLPVNEDPLAWRELDGEPLIVRANLEEHTPSLKALREERRISASRRAGMRPDRGVRPAQRCSIQHSGVSDPTLPMGISPYPLWGNPHRPLGPYRGPRAR